MEERLGDGADVVAVLAEIDVAPPQALDEPGRHLLDRARTHHQDAALDRVDCPRVVTLAKDEREAACSAMVRVKDLDAREGVVHAAFPAGALGPTDHVQVGGEAVDQVEGVPSLLGHVADQVDALQALQVTREDDVFRPADTVPVAALQGQLQLRNVVDLEAEDSRAHQVGRHDVSAADQDPERLDAMVRERGRRVVAVDGSLHPLDEGHVGSKVLQKVDQLVVEVVVVVEAPAAVGGKPPLALDAQRDDAHGVRLQLGQADVEVLLPPAHQLLGDHPRHAEGGLVVSLRVSLRDGSLPVEVEDLGPLLVEVDRYRSGLPADPRVAIRLEDDPRVVPLGRVLEQVDLPRSCIEPVLDGSPDDLGPRVGVWPCVHRIGLDVDVATRLQQGPSPQLLEEFADRLPDCRDHRRAQRAVAREALLRVGGVESPDHHEAGMATLGALFHVDLESIASARARPGSIDEPPAVSPAAGRPPRWSGDSRRRSRRRR